MKTPLITYLSLGILTVSNAATTAFVFDNSVGVFADGLNNGDSLTEDGITLTFSDVVTSNGSAFGEIEGVGILLTGVLDPTYTDVISFSITFSQRVQILTYDIGAREDVPVSSSFNLTGSNGTSGNNVIPFISGATTTELQLSFDKGTIPFFEANQAYSFTHNLPNNGSDALFNLEELAVEAVPEPSSSLLIGLGSFALMSRRTRRKLNS